MEILWLAAGVILGGVIGWLLARQKKSRMDFRIQLEQQLIHSQENINSLAKNTKSKNSL